MAKHYLKKDVYTAAMERVRFLFSEFDNILVAFSGGKDSSVCLNLCYDYAKDNNLLYKLSMYHIDYEAQYQATTDFVAETFNKFDGIRKYWLCLPLAAQCCCNMDGGTWMPWEKEKEAIWVRPMPENEWVVNENNCPFPFQKGQTDYTVQSVFSKWFARENGKTAVIVGIRATESLHRYSAVARDDKVSSYNGKRWCTVVDDDTVNAYILYDWETRDIWIYNARFGKEYNRLYNLYHMAGLNIEQMRVASPFNDCAANTLHLYRVIDPNSWGKMVSRVNGVNFTAIYGGTAAMGWKSIALPEGHTWEGYCCFLLDTLPEKEKTHCKSILDRQVEMNEESFYRMCVCILKNDYNCKSAEFGQIKKKKKKKKFILEKYRNL